jgi:hypothetical protein
LAVAGVATLAVGQVAYEPPAPPPRIYRAQIGRRTLELNQSELPVHRLGQAPKSVVVINDYTCHHCRDMHDVLDKARARYGQRFSITVVTVPLAAKCNPNIGGRRTSIATPATCHARAGGLAGEAGGVRADGRVPLQVAARRPEGGTPVEPEAARRFAVELVGEAALERAMRDPWIVRRISDNIDLNVQAGPAGSPS